MAEEKNALSRIEECGNKKRVAHLTTAEGFLLHINLVILHARCLKPLSRSVSKSGELLLLLQVP